MSLCKVKEVYLHTLGYDVAGDAFAENSLYFRNSLVRANYSDLKNDVRETTEYLELFLRSLIFGECAALDDRTLHVACRRAAQ